MSTFQLAEAPSGIAASSALTNKRQAVAIGEAAGPVVPAATGAPPPASGGLSDEDELQARLDNLRK